MTCLTGRWARVWRGPRHPSNDLRQQVIERDKGYCRYCLTLVPEQDIHIDHVYPYSQGGSTSLGNLVVACPPCNIRKKDTIGIWPKPLPLAWGLFEKTA